MLIIGESLNATIPSVHEAVIDHDEAKIASLAKIQEECGADMLDVNAAVAGQNEIEDLVWMVQTVQRTTALPLVLDSSNPEAIEAALGVYTGSTPIINSITGEMTEGHVGLLQLAVDHDCGLVGMCMDEAGISPNSEVRCSIAVKLFERATSAGLAPDKLYIDPLVMAIAADYTAGLASLNVLQLVHERLPSVRTFCGASNVSYGMPLRKLLNRTFVSMQAALGMDAFLINVRDKELMATLLTAKALIGQDEWAMDYIKAYRAGRLVN
ncbi:MAG: dihydropteroate synthase [Dehalococcoidia bacterium]